ncbi:hypothetical protein HNP49_003261 [Pseudomonas fluvialis]|uniref:Lipoprotein n=1 Tax=Pseudomonas fluvialis TaxID=1793966 RepID=A0A7X0BV17_9PSED|nr:hypothetical protein [Pseudomonas fluvialis]MBB6343073.1 hypothetical protein [Pseudomonas fluvialis]
MNSFLRITTLLLVLAGVSSCDSEKYKYKAFEKLSVPEKLQNRQCPKPIGERSLAGSNEQAFGPYKFQYTDNLLGIGAYMSSKVGDPKINQYGERSRVDDNQETLNFGFYLPDTIPTFLNYTEQRKRIDRGELFAVNVELFWSQRETVIPESGHTISRITTRSSSPWSKTTDDLMVKEQEERGLLFYIYAPTGNSIPSAVKFISCETNCTVISKIRKDVWLRYSYPSANIKCWRYIDEEVHRMLSETTSNWASSEK